MNGQPVVPPVVRTTFDGRSSEHPRIGQSHIRPIRAYFLGVPEHRVFLMNSGRLWELCTQLVGLCKTQYAARFATQGDERALRRTPTGAPLLLRFALLCAIRMKALLRSTWRSFRLFSGSSATS
jgi:hypothetical protein